MSSPPTISIVVPLYNKNDYVMKAIESALAQEVPPFEIIVIDDGSTDGGWNAVSALNQSSVKVYRKRNSGVSATRNAGLMLARGDLVNFMDADDLHLPNFISEIIQLATKHPEAVLYATGYQRLLPDGRTQPSRTGKMLPTSGLVKDFFAMWSRASFTFTSAICVRRELLIQEGLRFPEGERWGEDQDLWFRLAERGDMAFSPEQAVLYRVGLTDSATYAEGSRISVLPAYSRLAKRLEQSEVPERLRYGIKRLLSAHYLNLAENCLRTGAIADGKDLINNPHARHNFLRYLKIRAKYCRW